MKKMFLLALAVSITVFNINFFALAAEEAHEEHMHEHEHDEHAARALGAAVPGGRPSGEVSQASTVSLDIHPVKRENGIIDLNNKVCPVSGKEVSGKNFYEHNGVSYGLCCNMCERDFVNSPEKFALSHEVIEAALSQSK